MTKVVWLPVGKPLRSRESVSSPSLLSHEHRTLRREDMYSHTCCFCGAWPQQCGPFPGQSTTFLKLTWNRWRGFWRSVCHCLQGWLSCVSLWDYEERFLQTDKNNMNVVLASEFLGGLTDCSPPRKDPSFRDDLPCLLFPSIFTFWKKSLILKPKDLGSQCVMYVISHQEWLFYIHIHARVELAFYPHVIWIYVFLLCWGFKYWSSKQWCLT